MPSKRYNTILIDPPWPNSWGPSSSVGMPYPVMTVSEICSLKVGNISGPDSTLFLWTTCRMLPEALGVVKVWGFSYHNMITWCKPRGTGGRITTATEHLVIATRGKSSLSGKRAQFLNWFEADRTRHSEKPGLVRDMVGRVCEGPYVELFARDGADGWDRYGDEISNTRGLKRRISVD